MATTTDPAPVDHDALYEEWKARVRLPPGYGWCPTFFDNRPHRMGIDHVEGPAQPDAYGTTEIGFGFLQTGWLEDVSADPVSVARDLAATVLVNAMHEVLEFVQIDGKRIANPHPVHEEQWESMHEWMRMAIDAYAESWPREED